MNKPKLVNDAYTIRRAIGILGITLPLILLLGNLWLSDCKQVLPSISMYYFSFMGDVFVGIVVAISIFLFNYKGYDSSDNLAGKLACFFGLCVAFFPPYLKVESLPCTKIPYKHEPAFGYIHTGAAVLFFIVLAVYCLFLFTKHGAAAPSPQKLNRNTVYKICGYTIIAMLLLMMLVYFSEPIAQLLAPIRPVLTFESIALWAFGIAWLTKGEAWMADK